MKNRPWILTLASFVLLTLVASCGRNPPRPGPQQVRDILARGGPFAESSFHACLLTYYAQGLPLKQVQEMCETKLSYDDKNGFGDRGNLLGEFARQSKWFDPNTITAACNSGSSGVAEKGDLEFSLKSFKGTIEGRKYDLGRISAGGEGPTYLGLTREESSAAKTALFDKLVDAYRAYLDAKKAADEDPANANKHAEHVKKLREYMAAYAAAMQDPNRKPQEPKADEKKADEKKADEKKADEKKGDGKKGGDKKGNARQNACAEALQAAREIVGECQRTGWRSGSCQSLFAQLKGCPDPTLIYVDPDGGYTCGSKVDPEQLKNAFVEQCRELQRPVPGGPDPCEPPIVDGNGRFVKGKGPTTLCGDIYARIDPDSDACLGTVRVQSTAPDLNALMVWGLNKLGGPIVVLSTKPDPTTGDQNPWGPKPPPRNP
jgi:hypothetical protein